MAVIVVGGSGRRVGKTALLCGLIAAMPEFAWTAVKITNHDHGKDEPIWTEPGSTDYERRADTERYIGAGADRAVLLTTSPEELPGLMEKLKTLVGSGANLLFESNQVVPVLKPDACLAIGGCAIGVAKRSYEVLLSHADALVVHGDADREIESSEDGRPVFHVAQFEKISPALLRFVRRRIRTDLK